MIKDILQDIVAHTHSLGFLTLIKVTGSASDTVLESITEDHMCILHAKSHKVVPEFEGTFGMPNLEKLSLHLKNPEYQSNAKIELVHSEKDGITYPSSMHFENESSDFQNDYRFMVYDAINEKMKSVKFKGATWDITGKLKHTWAWPIMHVQSILNLDGEITMKISDAGAMQIIVDSGLIEYSYILPAMTK